MDHQRTFEECEEELRRLTERWTKNQAARAKLDLEAREIEVRQMELLGEMRAKVRPAAIVPNTAAVSVYRNPLRAERGDVQNAVLCSEFDRPNQIAKLVGKRKEFLAESDDKRTRRAVVDLFRQTINLLCTHQEYPKSLKPVLANDFIFLPNEIIHDVIESETYAVDNEADFANLALLDGSWADFAKQFAMYRSMRYSEIGQHDDFDKLKAKAPQLYEFIKFENVRNGEMFELLGNRFSTVEWSDCGFRCFGGSKSTLTQVINFFKRQLKSKWLRTLRIGGNVRTEELNGLFVEFVRRATFEELSLRKLPFRVFEEAHKAWKATEQFDVRGKKIKAGISQKTFEKMEKYFRTKLPIDSSELCWNHPVLRTAKTNLKLFTNLQSYHCYDQNDYGNSKTNILWLRFWL